MKTIGIDIGTTTISAAVLEELETLETRTVANDCFISGAYEWESLQDPKQIVEKAKAVLDELLALHPDTEGIGLTGQMHGIVYVDKNGKAVSPLHTWQDGRGKVTDENGRSLAEKLLAKCRTHAASGYGLVTHTYNTTHDLVPAQAESFCTIMDYFGMVLTGRTKPLVHVSNAAGFGLFDAKSYTFETDVLQQFGVDLQLLPEVTQNVEAVGTYKGIPVTTALGDNQASFLGSVGLKEGTALINMGTGGQLSVLSDTFFETEGIEARPLIEGKYILAGSALCSGRAYALLEQFFRGYMKAAAGTDEPQYAVMAKLAERGAAESEHMHVQTTFCGTRVDDTVRGSITNIGEFNFTPEALTYGVMTGMSRELFDHYDVIRRETGLVMQTLIGSGNAIRKNPVLQGIIRDMFEADLQLSQRKEEAASGAAISVRYKR